MNNADGLFYTSDGVRYVHRFENNGIFDFRLERLSYAPGSLSLLNRKNVWFSEISEDLIFVIGESGSGIGNFVEWLRDSYNCWNYKTSLDATRLDLNTIIDDTKKPWDNFNISDKSIYNKEVPSIVYLTNSIDCFSKFEDTIYSGYENKFHVYKLPRFNLQDLKKWSIELSKYSKCVDLEIDNFSKQIYSYTGGQPCLTSMLFRLVVDRLYNPVYADEKVNMKQIASEALIILSKTPPSLVSPWIKNLYSVIKNNGYVEDLLRKYVSGARKNDRLTLSEEDMLLYKLGWVGLSDPEDPNLWTMASQLHRSWARGVLLSLDRDIENKTTAEEDQENKKIICEG